MFENPLLRKRAGTLDINDLDYRDSELTRQLLALHDEIANNETYRSYDQVAYRDPVQAQRTYDFTSRALKNRFIPALVNACKKLPRWAADQVKEYIEDAVAKMTTAERWYYRDDLEHAGYELEEAFSYLHDALDSIREATRAAKATPKRKQPGKRLHD